MLAFHRSSRGRAIILLLAISGGAGCHQFAPAENVLVAPQAAAVYAPTNGPIFAAPQPGFVPGGVPSFPEALPAPTPPAFALPTLEGQSGAIAPQFGLPGPAAEAAAPAALPNPVKVPVNNHEFAWDQIVDVVADYFPIAREQRVQITSDLWTEGRIETPYISGATIFEPQRRDSVGAFNRWQSTLQTIRRRAVVRVVPEPDGYAVGIEVYRELEDLPRPEQATAGAASLRTGTSLPSVTRPAVSRTRPSLAWIPLGRDSPLEQQILAEIQTRLANAPRIPMSVTPMP